MIVKDEETNLKRCLNSVSGLFDEIIIVDTGSKDKTQEVAISFDAKIFQFQWVDDFSAARNFSFSKATCDYIMWLDADDILTPENYNKIIKLKPTLSADVYLAFYDYFQDDEGKSAVMCVRERIIKRGCTHWEHPIHEAMLTPAYLSIINTDIIITHKRGQQDINKDRNRNIRILEKAIKSYPNDQRLLYYFAKELATEGKHEQAIEMFVKYYEKPDFHENMVNGYLYMANAYLNLGRINEGMQCCINGITLDPRFAEFYSTIGQVYYSRQDWENAAHWFEVASRLPLPETSGTVLPEYYQWIPNDGLCMCYSKIGKLLEAYNANEKALTFKPNDERMKHNREFLKNILFPL